MEQIHPQKLWKEPTCQKLDFGLEPPESERVPPCCGKAACLRSLAWAALGQGHKLPRQSHRTVSSHAVFLWPS